MIKKAPSSYLRFRSTRELCYLVRRHVLRLKEEGCAYVPGPSTPGFPQQQSQPNLMLTPGLHRRERAFTPPAACGGGNLHLWPLRPGWYPATYYAFGIPNKHSLKFSKCLNLLRQVDHNIWENKTCCNQQKPVKFSCILEL